VSQKTLNSIMLSQKGSVMGIYRIVESSLYVFYTRHIGYKIVILRILQR